MELDIHLKIRCALQKNTNSILIFPSAVAHLYTIKLKAAGNHDFEKFSTQNVHSVIRYTYD